MALFEKIGNFWLQKITKLKNFFYRMCPWTRQLILFCRNNFFSAHLFLEIFFLQASGQFRFYSLSNELCSLEYWLLEKPLGNSSEIYMVGIMTYSHLVGIWLVGISWVTVIIIIIIILDIFFHHHHYTGKSLSPFHLMRNPYFFYICFQN